MVLADLQKYAENGTSRPPFKKGGNGVWVSDVALRGLTAPDEVVLAKCLWRLRIEALWITIESLFRKPGTENAGPSQLKGQQGKHFQVEIKRPDFLRDWKYINTEDIHLVCGVSYE